MGWIECVRQIRWRIQPSFVESNASKERRSDKRSSCSGKHRQQMLEKTYRHQNDIVKAFQTVDESNRTNLLASLHNLSTVT